MKKYIYMAALLLSSIRLCFAQSANKKYDTMIEAYFNEYKNQPKYKVTTMSEEMVRRSNDEDVWKHPSIARIMKQVKVYKFLNFHSNPDFTQRVLQKLEQDAGRDRIYNEYYKWELNGRPSAIIYTRGRKIITEIVYITTNQKQVMVSCFTSDNISLESIRSLVKNN